MKVAVTLALQVTLCGVFIFWTCGSAGDSLPIANLTDSCFRCLCHLPGCNMTDGCVGGYCGPFKISAVYWLDAGNVTLPGDDPMRNHAYSDCVRDYECVKRTITKYLERFAMDCNGDGVTDCDDFILINGNGPYDCSLPLNRSANGRRWLQQYEQCELN